MSTLPPSKRTPLTPQGRPLPRFNALKHGIHSTRILIADGPHPENPQEFKRLAAQFHADFAPLGIAEELLVERLIVLYWRLRRILVAESNLVAHRTAYALDNEIQTAVVRATLRGKTAAQVADDPKAHAQIERATVAAQLLRPEDIDRITAYESTLEKAFHRNLRELLDLQRRRQRPTTPTDPTSAPSRAQVAIRIDRLELHPVTAIQNPENEPTEPHNKLPIPITNINPSSPDTPHIATPPNTPEHPTNVAGHILAGSHASTPDTA